jgi:ribosome-binding factor A
MRNQKTRSSEPSQRQRRVGEQIRHVMSETLQRGHFDSELLFNKANTIAISEVIPSPDLKHARAYVISHEDEDLQMLVTELNAQAHVFQKDIAKGTNLKFTPKVRFSIDTSFDEARHIEALLHDLNIPSDDENL